MKEIYFGFKLFPFDIITCSDLSQLHPNTPCCTSEHMQQVYEALTDMQSPHSFRSLESAIPIHEIYVLGKSRIDNTLHIEGNSNLQQYLDNAISLEMILPQDEINVTHTIVGFARANESQPDTRRVEFNDLYQNVRSIAFERGNFVSEYREAIASHPDIPGMTEWFRTIAASNAEYDDAMPDAHEHVLTYVQAYHAEKESPEMHSGDNTLLIYRAIQRAANELCQTGNEHRFRLVKEVCNDNLRNYYDEISQFINPADYAAKWIPEIPEKYQQATLSAFNEFLDALSTENSWSTTQLTATAFHSAVHSVLQEIVEQDGTESDIAQLTAISLETQRTSQLIEDIESIIPDEYEYDEIEV